MGAASCFQGVSFQYNKAFRVDRNNWHRQSRPGPSVQTELPPPPCCAAHTRKAISPPAWTRSPTSRPAPRAAEPFSPPRPALSSATRSMTLGEGHHAGPDERDIRPGDPHTAPSWRQGPTPLAQAAQRRAPSASLRLAMLQLQTPLLPRTTRMAECTRPQTQHSLVLSSRSSMDKELAFRQPPLPSFASL